MRYYKPPPQDLWVVGSKTYELALKPVRAELFKATSIIYQRASLLPR